MPSKYYNRNFKVGSYYHIYNKGAGGQEIFRQEKDYKVFELTLSYYLRFPQGKALSNLARIEKPYSIKKPKGLTDTSLSLLCYVLTPTDFHLLVKQDSEPESHNSISNLMRRLSITYGMHFSSTHSTSGSLYDGKYKNVMVSGENSLVQLSKWIHRKPLSLENAGNLPIPSSPDQLSSYRWSSYKDYIGLQKRTWVITKDILESLGEESFAKYKTLTEKDPVNEKLVKPFLLA